jgi:hypothetical protein
VNESTIREIQLQCDSVIATGTGGSVGESVAACVAAEVRAGLRGPEKETTRRKRPAAGPRGPHKRFQMAIRNTHVYLYTLVASSIGFVTLAPVRSPEESRLLRGPREP